MKYYISSIGLSLCLVFTNCQAQEKEELSEVPTVNNTIGNIVKEKGSNFPNNTQLSIAVIDGDTTSYYGFQRQGTTFEEEKNEHLIFEIASVTKVFTAILFSKFIHEKKVSLQETLNSQFDFPLNNGKEIELISLANHTAGFPRIPSNLYPVLEKHPTDPYKYYTSKMLEGNLENGLVLESIPGEKYAYSNYGMGLLGYVLAKKEGSSYEDVLQKYIFQPLKMTHTSSVLANVDANQLVLGQNEKGEQTSNWNFTDALAAAGSIKSSVVDLEKFIRKNLEEDSVYSFAQKSTFKINPQLEIGLGWHIINASDTLLWHNGGTGGYNSSLVIDKKNKKAVVVLSNLSSFHSNSSKIDEICFSLLKSL